MPLGRPKPKSENSETTTLNNKVIDLFDDW